jgi:hypothetical protein
MRRASTAAPARAAQESEAKIAPKRPWFVAKRYGWGWTPATKEGWIATAAFLAADIAIVFGTADFVHGWRDYLVYTLLPLLGIITIFILVCYKTGEKPRWRWG